MVFRRGNVRVFLPLATGILLSLVLTLIPSLIAWLRRRAVLRDRQPAQVANDFIENARPAQDVVD
ncbi:MAG TPA: DUF2905 family protein [Candidatus Polarisedimenticolia bacterium]|nr:DUF2905 family protein [Candidatus Polarisedimenticolia bacterium]